MYSGGGHEGKHIVNVKVFFVSELYYAYPPLGAKEKVFIS